MPNAGFCDNVNKKHVIIFIVSFITGIVFVTLLLTGFFNRKPLLFDRKTQLQDTFENVSPVGELDNWWLYPELETFEIYKAPTISWNKFWSKFKNHSGWDLEYNNGSGWKSCKQNLTIIRNYTSNNSCKITLDFVAPYTADYRLTLGIDYALKKYFHKIDKYYYNLSYEKWNETFNVTFNFSDIASIPDIIITHGVKNVSGKQYFWFRARKNNVNQGKHVVLDPTYTVFSGTEVYVRYASGKSLVRQSNGTYWCCFYEENDVHIAWSEDGGETWSDYEVYGARTSAFPSMCVDSNDIVHLSYFGYTDADTNNYQIIYTNSTDWTNLVTIVYENGENYYFPSIAVDSMDNLHIALEWQATDSEVLYLNSTDNGGSWSDIQVLTSESNTTDDEWIPCLRINSSDSIHIVFSCEDHYNDFNDILHMQSDDGGVTWTDWEADPVIEENTDLRFPAFEIDDDDNMRIACYSTLYTDCYTVYNDSSGWEAYENLGDGQHNDLGVNDNNYMHCFKPLNNDIDWQYNNTVSWSSNVEILSDAYYYPNTITATFPIIDGAKTNRPLTGYAFVCAGGLVQEDSESISFNKSDDLTWETGVARSYQQVFSFWFSGDNISNNLQVLDLWFSGNNVSSDNQVMSFWYSGGNISSNQQVFSCWFSGNNVSTSQQVLSFWFDGGNISTNQQILGFWFSGNGSSRTLQQTLNIWFRGDNVSNNQQVLSMWFVGNNVSSNNQVLSCWFSGNNVSTDIQVLQFWYKGGNVSQNQQIINIWFSGNNVSNNQQVFSFWYSGNNITSNQQVLSFWYSGGNISSNQQVFSIWFSGSNVSVRSYQQVISMWFSGNNVSTSQQILSFWYSGDNVSSDSQVLDFYFTGGNISNVQQVSSFWYRGGNVTQSQQIISCWFSGNNISSEQNVLSLWYSGGNISSNQQVFSIWFSGGNVSVRSYQQVLNIWFSGNNVSSNQEILSFWYSGNNVSSDSQILQFWYSGGNISSNQQVLSCWFSGGNVTVRSYQQVISCWFRGNNVSSNSQVLQFWFSGNNITNNQQVSSFWYRGGNVTQSQQIISCWFSGNNISSNNQILQFWFSGNNISNVQQVLGFWYSGGNITTGQQIINIWFSGNNISNNQQILSFWFSGNNISSNEQILSFWFSGDNTTIFAIYITNPYPNNNSINIPLQPTLFVTINHSFGENMNVSWYWSTNESDTNNLIGSNLNFSNSTQTKMFFGGTDRATVYYWRVQVDDGSNYFNETFNFRSEGHAGYQIKNNYALAVVGILVGIFALLFVFFWLKKKKG